jgi:Peptidase inhibitor I78 family
MARWMSILLTIGCMSCSPDSTPDGNVVASAARVPQGSSTSAAPPEPAPMSAQVKPLPDTFPPLPSRNLKDLVAGCRHQNPEKRPRGSNCYGIFPEQCGADKAKAFVGQIASATVRERIRSITPAEQARFIMPLDAVIEDLRYGRLNVQLDRAGRIVTVDCY